MVKAILFVRLLFPTCELSYSGGAHQYEFYDYLGGENWREYAKCVDFKGTKLK